jgi:hypothetical protein
MHLNLSKIDWIVLSIISSSLGWGVKARVTLVPLSAFHTHKLLLLKMDARSDSILLILLLYTLLILSSHLTKEMIVGIPMYALVQTNLLKQLKTSAIKHLHPKYCDGLGGTNKRAPLRFLVGKTLKKTLSYLSLMFYTSLTSL